MKALKTVLWWAMHVIELAVMTALLLLIAGFVVVILQDSWQRDSLHVLVKIVVGMCTFFCAVFVWFFLRAWAEDR